MVNNLLDMLLKIGMIFIITCGCIVISIIVALFVFVND